MKIIAHTQAKSELVVCSTCDKGERESIVSRMCRESGKRQEGGES